MPRDPMIHAWRLVKSRHAATAFDGAGARLNGARWSSPGVRVAYASDSIALATLEILAHLHSTSILSSYSLAGVQFAGKLIEDLVADKLPSQWRRYPAPAEIQALGDRWVAEGRSAVLRVPSVIIPANHNYLLNPAHPDFGKVIIGTPHRFEIDARLIRR